MTDSVESTTKEQAARFAFAERPWSYCFRAIAIAIGVGGLGFNVWMTIVQRGLPKNENGLRVFLAALLIFGLCQHRILRAGLMPDRVMRWHFVHYHILGLGIWAAVKFVIVSVAFGLMVRMQVQSMGQWPNWLEGHNFWVCVWLAIWLLLAIGSVPAFRWSRKRLRIAQNHCVKCDYDLTGNQSGFCTECGFAVLAQSIVNSKST